jgi:hypothetical protein
MQNNLHIARPCPFAPKKARQSGEGFYCSKCDKVVVDFRDKSTEDIMAAGKDICGIFYAEQLGAQPKMRPHKTIAFALLTVFSFFGIQASPLSGKIFQKDKVQNIYNPDPEIKKEKKVKKVKRKRFRYGLFRRRLQGCLNF